MADQPPTRRLREGVDETDRVTTARALTTVQKLRLVTRPELDARVRAAVDNDCVQSLWRGTQREVIERLTSTLKRRRVSTYKTAFARAGPHLQSRSLASAPPDVRAAISQVVAASTGAEIQRAVR